MKKTKKFDLSEFTKATKLFRGNMKKKWSLLKNI